MPQRTRRSSGNLPTNVPRDNQQIQDDNQTSGESVLAGQTSGDAQQPIDVDTPNQAANRDPAEGPRDNADGGEKGDSHA
jgi:hypothetical protein